jgi:hypothetical protein
MTNNHFLSFQLQNIILLQVLIFICVILSFSTLFVNVGSIQHLQQANLQESLTFIHFQFSVVANIAFSVPIVIDFILSVFYKDKTLMNDIRKIRISQILILISIIFPNLAILIFTNPNTNIELLNCISTSRIVLLIFSFLYYFWITGNINILLNKYLFILNFITGDKYFKTKYYLIGSICFILPIGIYYNYIL